MPKTRHFDGVPVSGGVVIGTVFKLDPRRFSAQPRNIPEKKIQSEVARFLKAVEKSKGQVQSIRKKAEQEIDDSHASIFDSHLLMLEDPLIVKETVEGIKKEKKNAEYILGKVVNRISSMFEKLPDEYFAGRSTDVFDVANQILRNLQQVKKHHLDSIKKPSIVVAHDLGPSDTIKMDRTKVSGFITEIGGPTSHTAIMAKALEIPAVVGVGEIINEIETGDDIIVDGIEGHVIINPETEDIEKYRRLKAKVEEQEINLSAICQLPAETLDSYSVELSANIEIPDEIEHVKSQGADGIGLFRTEFIYLNKQSFPNEDEQYRVYRKVLEAMKPSSVIFRTLDIGGDKFISGMAFKELNPFLGLRAVRLGLANPEMFKTQLRAILRASAHGNAKIMFPMVSCIEEIWSVREIWNQMQDELSEKGIDFDSDMEFGIMVEIPSAAINAGTLAKEVDFFSIGTNDLIQYTLAIDRVNERVAHLYEPYNPAILHLVNHTITEAHKNGIWCGLCGEIAADPINAVILLGMGIDELSMGPIAIPEVKQVIRNIRLADARRLAEEILELSSASEIKRVVSGYARQLT